MDWSIQGNDTLVASSDKRDCFKYQIKMTDGYPLTVESVTSLGGYYRIHRGELLDCLNAVETYENNLSPTQIGFGV